MAGVNHVPAMPAFGPALPPPHDASGLKLSMTRFMTRANVEHPGITLTVWISSLLTHVDGWFGIFTASSSVWQVRASWLRASLCSKQSCSRSTCSSNSPVLVSL